jgi:hypothetical protein
VHRLGLRGARRFQSCCRHDEIGFLGEVFEETQEIGRGISEDEEIDWTHANVQCISDAEVISRGASDAEDDGFGFATGSGHHDCFVQILYMLSSSGIIWMASGTN